MSSVAQRCVVCGREVQATGRAKTYVHANQFHQRFNHQPVVDRTPMRAPAPLRARTRIIDLAQAEAEAGRVSV